jgi:hypothetical protein
MALGKGVYEIRMILGNVAARSELAMIAIVPRQRVVPWKPFAQWMALLRRNRREPGRGMRE